MTPSPVRVGTAGWNVPSRYAAAAPPGGSALAALRYRLVESQARGVPTWCIFDNTGSGAALGNALALAAAAA
jgi:hypothetical protein